MILLTSLLNKFFYANGHVETTHEVEKIYSRKKQGKYNPNGIALSQ